MPTTKETILDVSLELFSEKGYEGTGMEEIARNVGIRKASLYSHYSGKSEIFKNIFMNIINDYRTFTESLIKNTENLPVKQRLKKIFQDYVFYNKRNRGMNFWDRVYYFPPHEFKEYIYKMTLDTGVEFNERLREIFIKGAGSGELVPDAVSLLPAYHYMLNGLTLSAGLHNENSLEKEVDKTIDAFLNLI